MFKSFPSIHYDQSQDLTNRDVTTAYRAPWWLPGGHLQTIYARTLARSYSVPYRRERWETPDGDFIDLDWLDAPPAEGANLLVLFHGLEGCSASHYALSLMATARQIGWGGVVPHFRGCSGEMNRLARSYHSGDSREIDWILRRLKGAMPRARIYVVGVSLGGNMLLKWLGEEGAAAAAIIERAVTVSAPLDLVAAAGELDFGIKRLLYTRYFLRFMQPRVTAKIAAHDLQIDARALRASSTFRQFDDLFTAPVHGFKDAVDYWRRSSSKPWLKEIKVPTLLINALNDPFFPETALPRADEVSGLVTLDFPHEGGHVGFITGRFPGSLDWLPNRILAFFDEG
jgi:predicted alpha/beta-fold hydrolase